jgi:hypothetical protein
MKAINSLNKGDNINQISFALTGDGPKDRRILGAIADRYPKPNDKILWIPEIVSVFGRGSRRTGRFAGFSALEPVKMYNSKYKICSYLILIDHEYVNDDEKLNIQIERALRKHCFKVVETQQLENQAFLVKCGDQAHTISIRIVISGKNRRIEENEATLINLHFGTNVAPEKNEIAHFYNENHTNVEKLIRNSSRKNLYLAFSDLMAALDSIEN